MAARMRWQPASYNRNVLSLFNRHTTPESSDNEDSDSFNPSREFLDDDSTIDYFMEAIRDDDPASELLADTTADDWFQPGAEEPIPSIECDEEENPIAALSEDSGVYDFFFGPGMGLISQSRFIEDSQAEKSIRASDSISPVSPRLRSVVQTQNKAKNNIKAKDFGKRDIKPVNSMTFSWMGQSAKAKATESSTRGNGISQGKARVIDGSLSLRLSTDTRSTATTVTGSILRGRGFRKLEPLDTLKPPGARALASCKKKPVQPTPSQPTVNQRRPTRPRSRNQSHCKSHRQSRESSVISSGLDEWVMNEGYLKLPCPNPVNPKECSVPFVKGQGPFWQGQCQEDYSGQRPTELLTREEVLEQLKKANARIWELEISGSRDAWKIQFASDQLKEINTADQTILRLEGTLKQLEAAKKSAMDHLDLAGQEIRGLKDRRMRDAAELALAHLRISQLREEICGIESPRKRKWKSGYLERAECKRRKSWEQMKDRFLAGMQ